VTYFPKLRCLRVKCPAFPTRPAGRRLSGMLLNRTWPGTAPYCWPNTLPTWGEDLKQARIRMESMEHAARILLAARALGRRNRLSQEQIAALERMRGRSSHGQNDHGN
jgi:hypothetical protein